MVTLRDLCVIWEPKNLRASVVLRGQAWPPEDGKIPAMREQLKEQWLALRMVGPANALRAWLYSRRRRAADAALPTDTTLQGVGALHTVTPQPHGARVAFALASLEITFLAPEVVRLTWQPGALPPPYAVPQPPPWPRPDVAFQRRGSEAVLRTAGLELTITPTGLAFSTPWGKLLRREAWPARRGEGWRQSAWLHPEAAVFGLGERAAGPNLRPGTYRLWNQNPSARYGRGDDPLYIAMPVAWVLQPAGAYLVFFDNPSQGEVRLDDGFHVRFDHGALVTYFLNGESPAHIARRFAELTGFPALPPRWALGFHQSRWGYRTQEEAEAVLAGFREHEMPLAALHLDLDYMARRRVFTVDERRFPRLDALAERAAAQGVRLVTILNPGVHRAANFPLYEEGRAAKVFCRLPDGQEVVAPLWGGWSAFPDFTDPDARAWWGEHAARFADRWHLGGLWLDMNEPSPFCAHASCTLPLSTRHALEGEGGDHRTAHNVYGLQMARAAYEALRRAQPERRPWLLSRSGWVGLQRYAWTWTGDTESTWDALRLTIATVLGLSLSGIPFAGPDVGGFAGAPDAELYLRWLQLAALLPFFRAHSSRYVPPREPWLFAEPYANLARETLRFRQRLLPYLYTLAWQAHRQGAPLVRPLWWEHPAASELWAVDDAFLLGDALLVAPALTPGQRERFVRLPWGGWYDFWQPETLHYGPAEVVVPTPLSRTPLLVRAGALLPLDDGEALTLWLGWSTEGERTSVIYLDAGDGYAPGRVERWTVHSEGDRFVLQREVTGDAPFPYPRLAVHLHGARLRAAAADGQPLPLEDDGHVSLPLETRIVHLEVAA